MYGGAFGIFNQQGNDYNISTSMCSQNIFVQFKVIMR